MLPTAFGAPEQCAVTFPCQPWCTRSHAGPEVLQAGYVGQAHTRECLTNQAAEDKESCEKGYKHSCIRVQPKAMSAFRNFLTWAAVAHPPLSSETSWWRLQPGKEAWDLALDTLWWYPGAPDNWLGVTSSPRVWVAGGIFPSAIISTSSWKPGEKLWVNLYRCGWKDPLYWFNRKCHAGTEGCNGDVPSRPVGDVPTGDPEPPTQQEVWRKQWVNTILFGSGPMALVGWAHGDPPGFLRLPWPILPMQEPTGEGRIRPEKVS